MRKKIFLLAVLCLCMLGLTACSKTDPTTVDYNGHSYEELKSNCQGTVQALATMTEEDMSYYMENGSDTIVGLIDKWGEATAEFGSFVEFADFKIEKSGKTLTAAQTVQLDSRSVIFTCVYNSHSMELEAMTLDAVYSTGEKMSKAGMNTLMGIGTVFAVLILISLIIYAFNIIPYLQKKKQASIAATQPKEETVSPMVKQSVYQEQQTEDEELIAVIAAAIAAAEGTTTEGFVVRSIRRR